MAVSIYLNAVEFPDELEQALLEVERAHELEVFGVNKEISEILKPSSILSVVFEKKTDSSFNRRLKVEYDFAKSRVIVRYSRLVEAFRGLGRLLAATQLSSEAEAASYVVCDERAQFQTLGAMLDCSRCAVLTPKCVQYLIRVLAFSGLNTLQLYTEDTYPVNDEPFFGYFRGRFTFKELQDLDNYAYSFGIEIFPCIQTLGHLGQVLQWPRFSAVRDTHEVFLCNFEESYRLLYKMIQSACAPFRSKRIHIGMDEAHGLADGRYKQLFGPRDSTLVFLEHLKAVHDICTDLNRHPLIWSDMLFCLAAKDNSLSSYYDADNPGIQAKTFLASLNRREKSCQLPPPSPTSSMSSFKSFSSAAATGRRQSKAKPLAASGRRGSVFSDTSSMETDDRTATATDAEESDLPGADDDVNMDLVYWDYYHTDPSVYLNKIQQHRQLGMEPWVAGGIWTWNRLYTALPFTFEASRGCLEASKRAGIRNVFATIWGDDGNECDILSAIPGLVYFGEQGYTASNISVKESDMACRFAGICGGNWDDFVYASSIDMIPGTLIPNDTKTHFPPNISKWLLWQDTAYSIFTPQLAALDFENYYEVIAKRLFQAADSKLYRFNRRLRFPALLAASLALKCKLREQLSLLYLNADCVGVVSEMLHPRSGRLFRLRVLVDELWKFHRDEIWLKNNKPFGLEIIELRYGGLKTRLHTLMDRLVTWLYSCRNANTAAVEALEAELIDIPFQSPLGTPAESKDGDASFDDFYFGLSVTAKSVSYQNVVQSLASAVFHAKNIRHTEVYPLDELQSEPLVIWEHVGPALVLDFSRAYTPARALGTG